MSIGLALIRAVAVLLLTAAPLPAGEAQNQILAAEGFLQKGEYRKAVDTLNEVALRTPRVDPEIYMMLAVSKLNLEDPSGALQDAEHGLTLFPRSERIANYYVAVLPSILPPALTIKRLETMLAAIPDSAILRKALGKALMTQNKDDVRIEPLLNSASSALPRDAEAQFLYGQWVCLHDQSAKCIALLHHALELSPPGNYAAAVLLNGMVATAQDRLGNAGEARQAFERAFAAYLNLQPPVADVPFQFVKFLTAGGDAARASSVNAEILKRNPDYGPAHLEHAKLLLRSGELERAVDEAKAALPLMAHDKADLRAVHAFLVKALTASSHETEAEAHRRWVDENP